MARGPSAPATTDSITAKVLAAITATTYLTPSGVALVAIAVTLWLLGRWVGGRPLYLVSYGLLAVLGMSYVMGSRRPPIEGTRSAARPRLREGDGMDMTVGLRSPRQVNTIILEETVPDALGTTVLMPIPQVGDETVEHDYKLACRRRGAYELGPLKVKWGDPVGLTRREAVVVEPVELLVHPSTQPAADRPLTRLFEDPPFRPPVSRPWPTGMEFLGMRGYERGDDVRRIVWRAYARTGKLLVREAEQGITDKVIVLLDQDRANHTKDEPSPSFEAAVRVAASVGCQHLTDGYSVTLEGTTERLLPVQRGPSSRIALLDALARVERVDGPLIAAIERCALEAGRGQHLVVITPRLDLLCAARLEILIQRGTSVLIAALLYGEESPDALVKATALGAQVVEFRPRVPLALAFRHVVGAGGRR